MERKPYLWMLLLALVLLPSLLRAEGADNLVAGRYRYQMKGVVLDESGQPLPGAAVKVVGTMLGASTNASGEFLLCVEEQKE